MPVADGCYTFWITGFLIDDCFVDSTVWWRWYRRHPQELATETDAEVHLQLLDMKLTSDDLP